MLKSLINQFYNFIKIIEEKLYSPADIIPGMKRSIQFDRYSCAAHSVNVVINRFNYHQEFQTILNQLETDQDGTDTPEILRYLVSAGFKVSVNTNADLYDIRNAIINGYPVIITINEWEHWVTIYGISKSRVFMLDSNFKKLLSSVSVRKFEELWDDNWIAIVSR